VTEIRERKARAEKKGGEEGNGFNTRFSWLHPCSRRRAGKGALNMRSCDRIRKAPVFRSGKERGQEGEADGSQRPKKEELGTRL